MTSPGVASRRQIGPIGTSARVVIGALLFMFGAIGGKLVVVVIGGHLHVGLNVAALILGIVVFPAALLVWQWIRLRRDPSRLDATGPVATGVNILAFAILIGISFIPAISYLGFAAFVFYGASMLLAAARGYSGCEVLAVTNWLLHRDDQIGCLVLSPIDDWERRFMQSHPPSGTARPGP